MSPCGWWSGGHTLVPAAERGYAVGVRWRRTDSEHFQRRGGIGGVGVLNDFMKSMSLGFKAEGQAILLIGVSAGWLGQSQYLRDICGREEGAPPPVDLNFEKRNGEFIRKLIETGKVTAAHDLSDGGLAVALAEMAMEVTRDGFVISTDRSRLDIDAIQRFLSEDSYWARERTLEQTKTAIENSICFGLYQSGRQIGFARVVSDRATFAYLGDVFIIDEYRGRGLG